MGFSRQEYWSGLPFPSPGDLPNPRTEPASPESPALAGGFFITSAPLETPPDYFLNHEFVNLTHILGSLKLLFILFGISFPPDLCRYFPSHDLGLREDFPISCVSRHFYYYFFFTMFYFLHSTYQYMKLSV